MIKRIASKVLLIGWDAADWQMIDPLLEEGKMPHLAGFLEDGVRGNLASLQPVLSPLLWTSIATGKRADEHAITSFVEPSPEGNGIRSVSSTSRKCKAIWNILTQNGMRSNVVNWFASHPAEPIEGNIVSNFFPELDQHRRLPKQLPKHTVHPASRAAELASLRVAPEELGPAEILPFIPELDTIDTLADKRPDLLRQILAKTASVNNAVTRLMQLEPWDFTAVYYGAIDQVAHEFMPYHPPRMDDVSREEFGLYKEVMEGIYRFHDLMLNALLQYAGEDTTVIIVSDHGYLNGDRRLSREESKKCPEACHRGYGIACMKGPGIKKGESFYGASLLDIAPTVLTLLGVKPGLDMPGRVWLETLNRGVNPERVLSWELTPGEDGRHPEDMRVDPMDSLAVVQQLVDLGYIEAVSSDARESIKQVVSDRKYNLVRALIHAGKPGEAIPLLEELLEEKAECFAYLIQLSECYLRTAQIEKLETVLAQIENGESFEAPSERAHRNFLKGIVALSRHENEAGLQFLNDALVDSPDSPPILNRIGNTYLQCVDWERAEEAFNQVLAIDPENPFALDGMAQVKIGCHESGAAIDFALDAVDHLHFFPRGHFHLGVALAQCGENAAAIQAFEVCLGMAKNKQQVYYWLARLNKESNPQEAEKYTQLWGKEQTSTKYFFTEE
jgi:predicted AlkP superfamily phosphohydrolase/phosphomutase/tetratricopeptide (TPR) repeat protein